ncbi:MAG: GNAT family N-acetyltransferase [Nitriliruptor sp.]|nr:MAG: GNAT family N-acetyltransferase [Nitriliruptor sp.]
MAATSAPPGVADRVDRPVPPAVGSVRVLGRDDESAVALLLARAFATEPGNVALYPDPVARLTMLEAGMRGMFRTLVRYGSAHGIEVDGRLGAVALWHPPGVQTTARDVPTVLWSKLAVAPTAVRAVPTALRRALGRPGAAVGVVRQRAAAIEAVSAGPVWHLAFLGAAPEHRGRGLARRLLDRQLVRCDEDGVAVWLETTDPVNPPIYERFGFEVVTQLEDAAWLPGWWAMRREPRLT